MSFKFRVKKLSISDIESKTPPTARSGKYTTREFLSSKAIRNEIKPLLLRSMKLNLAFKYRYYEQQLARQQQTNMEKYGKVMKLWREKFVQLGNIILNEKYNALRIWLLLTKLNQETVQILQKWINSIVEGGIEGHPGLPIAQVLPAEISSFPVLDNLHREILSELKNVEDAITKLLEEMQTEKVDNPVYTQQVNELRSLLKSIESAKGEMQWILGEVADAWEKGSSFGSKTSIFGARKRRRVKRAIVEDDDDDDQSVKQSEQEQSEEEQEEEESGDEEASGNEEEEEERPKQQRRGRKGSKGSVSSSQSRSLRSAHVNKLKKIIERLEKKTYSDDAHAAMTEMTLPDINNAFFEKGNAQEFANRETLVDILEKHYPDFYSGQLAINETRETLGVIQEIQASGVDEWAQKNWVSLVDVLCKALFALKGRENVIDGVFAYVLAFAANFKNAHQYLNFALLGPAGSGKTSMAAYIGKILGFSGILLTHKFIQVTRSDMVAQYLGQTAPKTRKWLENAREGVLFLDEAYSLVPCTERGQPPNNARGKEWMLEVPCRNFDSYGAESLTEIVDFLSQNRGLECMIVAGYTIDTLVTFFEANEGIARRFPNIYILPSYTPEELIRIYKFMLAHKLNDGAKNAPSQASCTQDECGDLVCKEQDEISAVDEMFTSDALDLLGQLMTTEGGAYFSNQSGDVENLASITARFIGSHFKDFTSAGSLGVCDMRDVLSLYLLNTKRSIFVLDNIKCDS